MKIRLILIGLFLIIGLTIIYFITDSKIETWTYTQLPNNYIIEKKSDTEVMLGKYIDNNFITKKSGKIIGVEDYIAEFKYGNNYIALKCLDKSLVVKFYIIDTKNEDVYGPYKDEETFNKTKEKIIDEDMNDWIETITLK